MWIKIIFIIITKLIYLVLIQIPFTFIILQIRTRLEMFSFVVHLLLRDWRTPEYAVIKRKIWVTECTCLFYDFVPRVDSSRPVVAMYQRENRPHVAWSFAGEYKLQLWAQWSRAEWLIHKGTKERTEKGFVVVCCAPC